MSAQDDVYENSDVELENDWNGEQFLNFPQTKINAKAQTEAIQFALHSAGFNDAKIKQMDLLEAGCGPGAVTLHLAELFGTLTAVETSPNMLKVLSRQLKTSGRTDVEYALHPLSPASPERVKMPLRSPSTEEPKRRIQLSKTRFDVAVVNMVLHHVDDIGPFLAGLLGLMKPGGWIVFTEFNGEQDGIKLHEMEGVDWQHDPDTGEFGFKPYPHWFDTQSIKTVLEKAGLQDLKVDLHGRVRGEGGTCWIDCMVAWGRTAPASSG